MKKISSESKVFLTLEEASELTQIPIPALEFLVFAQQVQAVKTNTDRIMVRKKSLSDFFDEDRG